MDETITVNVWEHLCPRCGIAVDGCNPRKFCVDCRYTVRTEKKRITNRRSSERRKRGGGTFDGRLKTKTFICPQCGDETTRNISATYCLDCMKKRDAEARKRSSLRRSHPNYKKQQRAKYLKKREKHMLKVTFRDLQQTPIGRRWFQMTSGIIHGTVKLTQIRVCR